MGAIFLAWLPHFLSAYPGYIAYDALYQIRAYLDHWYNAHHPVIHSLMLTRAFQSGVNRGDISSGLALYTLVQMMLLAFTFALFLYLLRKMSVPRYIRIGLLLWYCFFPAHQIMALGSTKDVLCAGFFLVYITVFALLLREERTLSFPEALMLVIAGMMSCLFRNNMSYALLAGGLLTGLFIRPRRKKLLVITLVLLSVGSGYLANRFLIHLTKAVQPDQMRETLSMPLQSMARTVNQRRDEIDEETLSLVEQYIPPETISQYLYFIADAVKNDANEDMLRENLSSFFRLWLSLGLRFPDEYVESVAANTIGFWYPLNLPAFLEGGISNRGITELDQGYVIEYRDHAPWFQMLFGWLYRVDARSIPVLGFLHRSAFTFWMMLLLTLYSVWKKNRYMLLLSLTCWMYFGTCFLGPVVFFRYIYCLVCALPLLWLSAYQRPAES
ncbi:MAG: hypothetical protein IK016_05500 [Lachnospiraceae bacterium]|nr:hypothetical protein [Lachnospiraceae bacterium]